MPFRASASPSLCGLEPAPSVYAPPKIQNITGRRSDGDGAAVQTFRYRQSSLAAGESGRSTDTFRRPMPFGCTQTSPNVSALRTPVHFATGCGARHRNAPTGGAANGTPLNTRTPGAAADVAESRPASILTVGAASRLLAFGSWLRAVSLKPAAARSPEPNVGCGTAARKPPPAIASMAANA